MKPDVIANKIESIRRCMVRIEQVRKESAEALMDDVNAQDIVCLNVQRAVQLSVDLAAHLLVDVETNAPDTMSAAFRSLAKAEVIDHDVAAKMVKAVGFRNIAVHAYREIDWVIVHAISMHGPDDFREYLRQVMAFCEGRES